MRFIFSNTAVMPSSNANMAPSLPFLFLPTPVDYWVHHFAWSRCQPVPPRTPIGWLLSWRLIRLHHLLIWIKKFTFLSKSILLITSGPTLSSNSGSINWAYCRITSNVDGMNGHSISPPTESLFDWARWFLWHGCHSKNEGRMWWRHAKGCSRSSVVIASDRWMKLVLRCVIAPACSEWR